MKTQVFTNEDAEGVEAIEWLFDGYLKGWFYLKPLTVAVTMTGNEDAPERIELHDINHYQAPPLAIFTQDAEGKLQRQIDMSGNTRITNR